jgi:hypothetical protein
MIGSVSLSYQPFVAKIDATNALLWVNGFTVPNYSYGYESNRVAKLAVLPEDAVAFAGNAQRTTIDLGAGPVGSANEYENAYFGVLEPGGALRWGKVFNAPSSGGSCCSAFGPSALAVGPTGDVISLGRTYGGLQLGATAVAASDGYVLSLAAADGAVTRVKALDLANDSFTTVRSLSVDALGHVGIGSFLAKGSSLGGGPVAQAGAYITKLDEAGAHLWTKQVPFGNDSFGNSGGPPLIASTKDAGMLFTGSISGVQSFDGTTVGQSNSTNVVFGKLAP